MADIFAEEMGEIEEIGEKEDIELSVYLLRWHEIKVLERAIEELEIQGLVKCLNPKEKTEGQNEIQLLLK